MRCLFSQILYTFAQDNGRRKTARQPASHRHTCRHRKNAQRHTGRDMTKKKVRGMNNQYSARPFIKWAGGKGQLLPQLLSAFPNKLRDDCFTYVEPFVGGGAMLFFLLQRFPNIKRAIINDVNSLLTDAYNVVKSSPDALIDNLKGFENEYKSLLKEGSR